MLCRPRHNIHLIRNTFRLASRKDWDALKHDVKPIYTAVNAEAARSALEELTEKWGPKYGAIIRLWNNAWEEFIPFLDYDVEIRTVLCSTNAIVSLESPRGCWWPSRGVSRGRSSTTTGSGRAASTSVAQQPNRAALNTHSVLDAPGPPPPARWSFLRSTAPRSSPTTTPLAVRGTRGSRQSGCGKTSFEATGSEP
jgi:hypothetical protein